MSFELLMGTFAVGIAAMLLIMGSRQWKLGYRVSGGLSLSVAAVILVATILVFLYQLDFI